MTRFAGHVDYAGSEAQTFVAIVNEGPRDKGKVPKKQGMRSSGASGGRRATRRAPHPRLCTRERIRPPPGRGLRLPKVVIFGFRPFATDGKTAKGSETGRNGVSITWNFKP